MGVAPLICVVPSTVTPDPEVENVATRPVLFVPNGMITAMAVPVMALLTWPVIE